MFVLYCSEDMTRKLEHMHCEFCAAVLTDNTLILAFWTGLPQKLRGKTREGAPGRAAHAQWCRPKACTMIAMSFSGSPRPARFSWPHSSADRRGSDSAL
jgi:hypothetical protein